MFINKSSLSKVNSGGFYQKVLNENIKAGNTLDHNIANARCLTKIIKIKNKLKLKVPTGRRPQHRQVDYLLPVPRQGHN